jgi:cell wall-associated NlpC family hydrolase
MPHAICLLSVVPMRKEPSHRSEMVSQVLFGEYVTIQEEKDDFVFVRCDYDGYEGWVQAAQLTQVSEHEVLQTNSYTTNFTTPVTHNQTLLHVPYAAPVYQPGRFAFQVAGNNINYLVVPQQTVKSGGQLFNGPTLTAVCQPLLNAPYLWGGKSVFGIDCSGFVQQVFKLFGIKLLRDAYLQAGQGIAINSLKDARLGDLAFFCNEAGRVTHVGITLEDGKIIHASGRVRIDTIDKEGILNIENGKRTHMMHSIRRYF